MQLKHFFVQDHNRTALPGATCTLYLAGTTTLATGLQDAGGNAIDNPMTADDNGLLQFAAPDGEYDLTCESGMRVYTLRVQFLDASEQIQYIEEQKAVVQQYANLVVAEYKPPVQPSLVCDFARNEYRLLGQFGLEDKTLPQQVTFTRASTATRVNALGLIEEVPVDTPRIDYDPVTGECKGLLIEEQRTNLLTYSSDFDNGAWSKPSVSVTGNSAKAPDGTMAAGIVLTGAVNTTAPSRSLSTLTSSAGDFIYSLFLRSNTPFSAGLQITNTGYTGYLAAKTIEVTDEWQRFDIPFSGQAGAAWLRVTDAGTEFEIWGAQLEEGLFPTSHIPTAASQVTRAKDVCSTYSLAPWFNSAAGALLVEMSDRHQAGAGGFSVSLGTDGANYIGLGYVTQNGAFDTAYITSSGVSVNISSSESSDAVALSWGDSAAISVAGGEVVGSKAVDVPGASSLLIGRGHFGSSVVAPAHYKSVRYYPRALSASELQELTA